MAVKKSARKTVRRIVKKTTPVKKFVRKTPARKTPARKTPARKVLAKKTPVRKIVQAPIRQVPRDLPNMRPSPQVKSYPTIFSTHEKDGHLKVYNIFPFKDEMKREMELSCMIGQNVTIQDFCIGILIDILQFLKRINKLNQYKDIMKMNIETIENNQYITKPGLTDTQLDEIVYYINTNNTDAIHKFYRNKIHLAYGSLYGFTYTIEMYIEMINLRPDLQEKVRSYVYEYFHVNMAWVDFREYLKDPSNKWILLDIFISSCTRSLMRSNLNNKNYIRTPIQNSYIKLEKNDNILCHAHMKNNTDVGIVYGNSFYRVNEDSIYSKIMNRYKRNYLAGPSGSIILLHIFVFDILQYEKTTTNQLKLLALCVADYIPFSHTLTELLLSYSNELDITYTLDMDPIKFTRNLLTQYIPMN